MGFTLAPLPKNVVSKHIKKTEGKINTFCGKFLQTEKLQENERLVRQMVIISNGLHSHYMQNLLKRRNYH